MNGTRLIAKSFNYLKHGFVNFQSHTNSTKQSQCRPYSEEAVKRPMKDPSRFVKKKFKHLVLEKKETPKRSLSFNIHPLAFMGVLTIGYSLYGLFENQKRVGKSIGQTSESFNQARQDFLGRNLKVLFVVGGPSTGKTEFSRNLAQKLNFEYLSLSDLLSVELQRPYSPHRDLITDCFKEGKDIPSNICADILRDAISETQQSGVIIDGFPRKLDQAIKFQDTVLLPNYIIELTCPLNEMIQRFHASSPEGDFNKSRETIQTRSNAVQDSMSRVVNYYKRKDNVITLSCLSPVSTLIDQVIQKTNLFSIEQPSN